MKVIIILILFIPMLTFHNTSHNSTDYITYMKNKMTPHETNNNMNFQFKSANDEISMSKFNYDSKEKIITTFASISSPTFKNDYKPIILPDGTYSSIKVNEAGFRINTAQCPIENKFKKDDLFYFSLDNCVLYYTATPTDQNYLGMIKVKSEVESFDSSEDYSGEDVAYCINLIDYNLKEWKVCQDKKEDNDKWLCLIARCLNMESKYNTCLSTFENRKKGYVKQPVIIIPKASPICNNNWDYNYQGQDWVCECIEGIKQTPINLPSIQNTLKLGKRPYFEFSNLKQYPAKGNNSFLSNYKNNDNNIQYNNHLEINHENLSKVTTENGVTYTASKLTFHTPSNHMIEGKQFDMEISVIYQNDTNSQVMLSFLIESFPGVENKFFKNIDFFDLPNEEENRKELISSLNIVDLFDFEPDSKNNISSFSFYSYEGSIPFPPCSENTIVYVCSDIVKVSPTVIAYFKQSLKSTKNNIFHTSNRAIQNLNKRPIFHYQACKKKEHKEGHFEKITEKANEYIYVNSNKPSGIPGSLLVSKSEAVGEDKFD